MDYRQVSASRAEAGRKGGLATLEKYGKRYMKRLGKKGGRPRHDTGTKMS